MQLSLSLLCKRCYFAAGLTHFTTDAAAGAMLPFMSREDVDFFVHLEMYLRQENPPLCGRDHLAFRSAYFPVKDVVDGDLCEQYAQVRAAVLSLSTACHRRPAGLSYSVHHHNHLLQCSPSCMTCLACTATQ